MNEHVPPCGLNPVCLTLCSRFTAVCLSLHSERCETLLAPGSGSTSLGGSTSSSLSSSSSCCGRCGISTSCCLDMLHPVAPRRQGPWVPFPRTLGSLGPLPSCAVMPPTLFREFLYTEGVHPTASGRRKEVVLFRQTYPALTNGGVDDAVVPCGP